MRTIIHLSDLHFGRNEPSVIKAIIKTVKAVKPDVLIVSGDLTQRAKAEEFKQAKDFLNGFNIKKIVIPGNHDIPLFNPLKRLVNPFKNYKKYISKNLEPVYFDKELRIIGVNTARKTKITRGKISSEQAQLIKEYFADAGDAVRIVVAHHPFDLPEGFSSRKMVIGAKNVIKEIVDAKVDLILGGHMHISHTGSIADRYKVDGKAALVVQASTVSKRSRGEVPTFNVIKTDLKKITLTRYVFKQKEFKKDLEEVFQLEPAQWVK
ncbi:MAG: metallophosphoesterase [Candidatus Doudnabacteria bacterium]|nr:metallophosphoesterase [Candidatus Doudnabacteria bacterium]